MCFRRFLHTKNPHKPQDFLKTPCKRMGGVGQSIRGSTALHMMQRPLHKVRRWWPSLGLLSLKTPVFIVLSF